MREAGKRLNLPAERVRGLVDAIGITLTRGGPALIMSEADYGRLAKQVRRIYGGHESTAAAS